MRQVLGEVDLDPRQSRDVQAGHRVLRRDRGDRGGQPGALAAGGDEALDAGGAQRVDRVMDERPAANVDETLGAAFLESAALAGSEDESVHAVSRGEEG